MIRKSTIWFFIISCVAEQSFSNSRFGNGVQGQSGHSQETLTILLNIVNTPASCQNTNGSITVNATGGTAPLSYSINNGASFQSGNYFSGLDSGQYHILVRDVNGVTADSIIDLTALPTPIVSLGSDTVLCTGSILSLSVAQQPGYSYLWSDNSTGNSYLVTKAEDVSLKVTNQFGCYVSTSINVLFKTTALFSLGNDTTLCNGQSFQLYPTPALSGNYVWSNGSTSPSLSIHSPGIYWLKITDSGCVKRDSILIKYRSNPQVHLGPDTAICTGQVLMLDVYLNGSVYDWQDGSTNPTYTVTRAGTYSVRVSNGVCDTTARIRVDYLDYPQSGRFKDTTICLNQELTLNAEIPNATYLWQDGSVLPQFTVTKAGSYFVEVTNLCGSTKDSITVGFENCACQMAVPNAFTPNGDGMNDIFLPKSPCPVGDYQFNIYNRFGQLVFSSKNSSLGWDGRMANQQQPTGTYIWELNYSDISTGKRMYKKGTVTLIR